MKPNFLTEKGAGSPSRCAGCEDMGQRPLGSAESSAGREAVGPWAQEWTLCYAIRPKGLGLLAWGTVSLGSFGKGVWPYPTALEASANGATRTVGVRCCPGYIKTSAGVSPRVGTAAAGFLGLAASVPSLGEPGIRAATGSGHGFLGIQEPAHSCPCLPMAWAL